MNAITSVIHRTCPSATMVLEHEELKLETDVKEGLVISWMKEQEQKMLTGERLRKCWEHDFFDTSTLIPSMLDFLAEILYCQSTLCALLHHTYSYLLAQLGS
jgi:hypothetical protein